MIDQSGRRIYSTLDKYGQVKGKRLTKQAGHMLELLDREAVAAKVEQGSVTNDSFKYSRRRWI